MRSGESLYSIAWEFGLDYKQIASWNGINKPYTIQVGQRLRLRPPSKTVQAPQTPPKAQPGPSQ